MTKIRFILPLIILLHLRLFSQVTHSREVGAGNVSALFHDETAVYYNPAALAYQNGLFTSTSYVSHFLLKELDFKSAALSYSKNNFGIGGLLFQTGDVRMNTYGTHVSYAQRFGEKFSIGIKLKFEQFRFSGDYGSKTSLSGAIGAIADVSTNGRFSFFIINPSRQMTYSSFNQRLPAIINLGYRNTFSSKFSMALMMVKATDQNIDLRLGADYRVLNSISLRLGFQSLLKQYSFGAGIPLGKSITDLSCSWNSSLGISLGVGFSWQLKSRDDS